MLVSSLFSERFAQVIDGLEDILLRVGTIEDLLRRQMRWRSGTVGRLDLAGGGRALIGADRIGFASDPGCRRLAGRRRRRRCSAPPLGCWRRRPVAGAWSQAGRPDPGAYRRRGIAGSLGAHRLGLLDQRDGVFENALGRVHFGLDLAEVGVDLLHLVQIRDAFARQSGDLVRCIGDVVDLKAGGQLRFGGQSMFCWIWSMPVRKLVSEASRELIMVVTTPTMFISVSVTLFRVPSIFGMA